MHDLTGMHYRASTRVRHGQLQNYLLGVDPVSNHSKWAIDIEEKLAGDSWQSNRVSKGTLMPQMGQLGL